LKIEEFRLNQTDDVEPEGNDDCWSTHAVVVEARTGGARASRSPRAQGVEDVPTAAAFQSSI
jgi:hypothetical protein